jgi:RNA polymerase sigma-70 factor (ECF subfamily)
MNEKEKRFETIQEDFGDKIYRFCCCHVGHEEDRRDLLHDIYVRIWSGLDSFNHKSSLSTWIYRISANSCIDFLRKERRRRRFRAGVRVEDQEVVDSSANAGKDFLRSERIQFLHAGIERLSLLDKTLISLYLEDLSYREIADVVGISESNVGVKLFRIKRTLNSFFKDAGQ